MSSAPLVLRIVASSVSIVHRAGLIIREILKAGDLGIVDKGKNDLQTAADRSAQQCIVASLRNQYPNIPVIGEEDLDPNDPTNPDWVVTNSSEEVLQQEGQFPEQLKNVKDQDVCIWVDPLDGTAEFTEGLLDHVTVLVGIAVNGKAVAGVIYQPYYNYKAGPDAPLGRIIWGIVGLGAFGFEKHPPPADKRIITTTRSHMTKEVQAAIDSCNPTEVLRVGGAGHKVLLLIEGLAHAYLFASRGCKKWDTCAPEAVLHAIGGRLTDVHGNDYTYESSVKHLNAGGTLATALAADHSWYLSKISDDIKKLLPV